MPIRDPDRIVLLSDVHVSRNPAKMERGANMAWNLRRAIQEILTPINGRLPDRVMINGDLAHHRGKPADYIHAHLLLRPIVDAGVPLHVAMGNHDHRGRFLHRFDPPGLGGGVHYVRVDDRLVLIITTRQADFILLDSLDITHAVPGRLGQVQLDWLARALDDPARAGRAVIILMHHNPEIVLETDVPAGNGIGADDTQALMEILVPRRQVKALLWGHLHRWERGMVEGLHLVCLPSTAWVFRPMQPIGWIDCHLSADSATLTLHSLDPQHPRHLHSWALPYRH